MKRERLEGRLTRLESGHDEIAKRLQIKAQALGALPREMRDAIFEQLYRLQAPISPEITRVGPNTFFKMPKDTALYMSQRHVGEAIAEEAAEIFYTQNTFHFGPDYSDYNNYNGGWSSGDLQASLKWSLSKYDLFLDSDHYQSRVRPCNFIRKASIWLANSGRTVHLNAERFEFNARGDNPRQIGFEQTYRKWRDRTRAIGAPFFDDREHLEYFLNLDGLKEFTIVITVSHGDVDSMCRLINPSVRRMKDRHVKVKVINRIAEWENTHLAFSEQDISCFFDAPSTGEYTLFKEQHPASLFVYDSTADPMEVWWIWIRDNDWDVVGSFYDTSLAPLGRGPILPQSTQARLFRVWLHEAYEVFKFYQEHRIVVDKLNEMWEELRSFDAEEVVLRRRYYGRMMELIAQQR